jgi:hypothetical protein
MFFGDSFAWILFAQLFLGSLQPWVIFHLARRMADERVALVAAALSALYGPLLFYQGTLLRDWIPPLLEPLTLVMILKASESPRRNNWMLAGLMMGLAMLAKERILLFVPLVCLWIFWKHRERKSLQFCAFLLVGMCLMLIPIIARNLIVGVPPLALSNRAAEFFIEGNAADAFPVGLRVPDSMAGILERSNGKFPAVIRETLITYQGDWLAFSRMQLLKLRALLDPLEVPNNLNYYYGVEISRALRWTIGYGFLLPVAVLGLLLAVRLRRDDRVLLLYGLVIFAGLMMSNISSRQRLALVPVLIFYAALGIVWLWDALQAKQIRRAAFAIVVLICTALIQQFVIPIRALRSNLTYAVHPQEYLISAYVYAQNAEWEGAIDEIARLRSKAERHVPHETGFLRQVAALESNYRAKSKIQNKK